MAEASIAALTAKHDAATATITSLEAAAAAMEAEKRALEEKTRVLEGSMGDASKALQGQIVSLEKAGQEQVRCC